MENITGVQATKHKVVKKKNINKFEGLANLDSFQRILNENSITVSFQPRDIQEHNEKTILNIMKALSTKYLFKGVVSGIDQFDKWATRIMGSDIDFAEEIDDEYMWKGLINKLKGSDIITDDQLKGKETLENIK